MKKSEYFEYYLNKMPRRDGKHELHLSICLFAPNELNRIELGEFHDCDEAIEYARNIEPNIVGCLFCSPLCYESENIVKI